MPKLLWKQASQNCSTEGDSASDRQQQIFFSSSIQKTNPLKHKTELCKTFSQLGFCNYGPKCRFAHGKHQLISSCQVKLHQDRKCKGFWKNGVCPYGMRCQFRHGQNDWTSNSFLIGLAAVIKVVQTPAQSRLLRMI